MESTSWRREYSCVLGVSSNWDSKVNGGDFILKGERVPLEFNQLVVFKTDEESFHEVLDVTGNRYRKSLCVFYWSDREPIDPNRSKAKFFH